jgi:hypothetical protein
MIIVRQKGTQDQTAFSAADVLVVRENTYQNETVIILTKAGISNQIVVGGDFDEIVNSIALENSHMRAHLSDLIEAKP